MAVAAVSGESPRRFAMSGDFGQVIDAVINGARTVFGKRRQSPDDHAILGGPIVMAQGRAGQRDWANGGALADLGGADSSGGLTQA